MTNDRERLTTTTGWVEQRSRGLAPRHVERRHFSLPVLSQTLAPFLALIVAGSLGFAGAPNNGSAEPARASIEGVINLSGQEGNSDPIPGVRVTLTATSSSSQSLSTTTDETGRYQFIEVASGVYRLEADLEGFQTVTKTTELKQGQVKVEISVWS